MLNKTQCGVSLIESMIALLVISIGLLGIAALQVTSIKQNSSALNHSQAVWLSYDMADRIRANYGQIADYVGIDTDDTPPTTNCIGAVCSAAEITESDAREWTDMVKNLPSGQGTVTNLVANEMLIRVMWDEGEPGTSCGGVQSNLTCYEMTLAQ